MAHKTKAQWDESRQDLDMFLQIGDTVDEEMWDYFLGVLPPAYCSGSILQIGEPCSHVRGYPTYSTLARVANDMWEYRGHCFRAQSEAAS